MFTRYGRNVVTLARPGLCTSCDIPRSVVPVHKIMNSRSRAPKLMRDIIYRRPRLEPANNVVSLIFERRAVTKSKRFVTIRYFLLPGLSCKCFLVSFKAVNEPPVPQHVQRTKHVFQALILE